MKRSLFHARNFLSGATESHGKQVKLTSPADYLRRFIERWDGASDGVQDQLAKEYSAWCDLLGMPHVCAEENLKTLEENKMKKITLVTSERNNAQAIYRDGSLYEASNCENLSAQTIIEAAGSDDCAFEEESVEDIPSSGWPEMLEELRSPKTPKENEMKKFTLFYAFDCRCYGSTQIEAETLEEAKAIAKDRFIRDELFKDWYPSPDVGTDNHSIYSVELDGQEVLGGEYIDLDEETARTEAAVGGS